MNLMKIVAQLILDGTKFKAGLREAKAGMRHWAIDFGSSVKGELAAVFGGAAIASYLKNTIQSIGALKDQAEQARVSTAEFQRLGIAAQDAGLKEEDWINGQVAFDKNRREAVESNYELRKTFEKYGFTLDDLQNPQKRFMDFLQAANVAMQNMTPEQKARASVELFDILGKLGPKVQGFLQSVEKFKDAPIVSDKSIESVKKADDALTKLGRKARIAIADKIHNPWQALVAPVNLFRTIRSFTSGDPDQPLFEDAKNGKGLKTAPGAPSRSGALSVASDEKLFRDGIAEKHNKEALEARLSLEQAIYKVKLQQMTASDQIAAKEKLLNDQLDMVAFLEGQGLDAFKERENAIGTLSELLNERPGELPTSSLTNVGQLGGGRSFVNSSQNAFVNEVKKLLGVNIEQKNILTEIKNKKGSTIN